MDWWIDNVGGIAPWNENNKNWNMNIHFWKFDIIESKIKCQIAVCIKE